MAGTRQVKHSRRHARFRARYISDMRLEYQTDVQSGLSVQDLNLLNIKVVYRHPLQVPLVATTLRTLLTRHIDDYGRKCLQADRVPLASSAVVRMNTDYCPQACCGCPKSCP